MSEDFIEPRRRGLSLDIVVGAAIELAVSEGVQHLSMRRLATRLGVEAMSLYYYVPNKASLIASMAERTLLLVPASDPSQPWGEQLHHLLINTFAAAQGNPVLLQVLLASPMPVGGSGRRASAGGATERLFERIVTLLEQGGIPARHRHAAFQTMVAVTVGFIAAGTRDPAARASRPLLDDQAQGLVGSVPGQQRSSSPAPVLTAVDPAHPFRFALSLCIDGLRQLADESEPVGGV